MKIAIVILNWNGRELLETFLPSIVTHSQEADIYVADNASDDDSVAFVKTNFPTVKIIRNKENYGFAQGYNEALKQVDADIFCLLNSDVEVTKDWLVPIMKIFQVDNGVGIVQPKILDYKRKEFFEYAGAAGGFIDKFGYAYCRGRIFNTVEKDNKQYRDSSIFWASGACLFIRKKVFWELDGFDETFFAHYEEIDLCWRAFNLKHKAVCCTNSTVFHVGGATLNTTNPRKTYLNFRNSLFTLVKNAHGNIFYLVLIRLLLDAIAGLRFILRFQISHFFAIIRAHFSFYAKLGSLLKFRKTHPKKKNYFHPTSIVWDYFIKNIKHFDC